MLEVIVFASLGLFLLAGIMYVNIVAYDVPTFLIFAAIVWGGIGLLITVIYAGVTMMSTEPHVAYPCVIEGNAAVPPESKTDTYKYEDLCK